MTDFSFLHRQADQAQEEVERLIERAAYYKERQDRDQTLINYVKALEAYAKFSECRTDSIRVEFPIDIRLTPRETSIIYSQTLLDVASILVGIRECYTDSVKKAFLEQKLQIISTQLPEYESYLEARQLERCDNLRTLVKNSNSNINNNRTPLEELTKKPLKELNDQEFVTIRSALARISETKVCPVVLDSVGGCFIATAAYSTSIHPDLDTFRMFRDDYLLTHSMGQKLVNFYYQVGPSLAQFVEKQPAIKHFVRQQLERLAKWMRSQGITR